MSQLNDSAGPYPISEEDSGERRSLKLYSSASTNDSADRSALMKSLVPPHCDRKFENLQEYLLEVSKALDQRQSFYSVNLADILWKIQKWKDMLPNVGIFYAMKANPDPVLLKLLVLLGTSFDCSTEGEIQAVLDAGAPPSSILWAHTVKPADGLLYARSVGVDIMTYDDEEELKKIHRVFPDARLILRILPSIVKCKFDLSDKFGCSKSQAVHLLRLAKQLGMNVEGLSFHVGSLCTDPECFSATIKDCREIFDQARQMGLSLSILDIGGGFFGCTGSESIFSEVVDEINKSLEEHFRDTGVKVIAEPGCYLAGSAFDLVSTVLGKRTRQGTDGVRKHYFINNGVYSSFFIGIERYDIQAKPLLGESELRNRSKFESVIFGQTCCCEDVIQRNCLLTEMEVGECMLWENMGAYSIGICSTFCAVPLPESVYVFDHNPQWTPNKISMSDAVRAYIKKHAVFIGRSEEELSK